MEKTIESIPLDGGRLCLDFINTVYSWKTEERSDFLVDYQAFLVWCQRLAVPVIPKAVLLKKYGPLEQAAAWRKIIGVRGNLYEVFSAVAAQSKPGRQVEEDFNFCLSDALARQRIFFGPGAARVVIDAGKDELIGPVFHILKSCYDVLTRDEIGRIKQCSSCGWIFYDTTKNNGRRWCNPLTCGSMDKSKRYYWRNKERPRD
jgi:predicted RNA-binding Zn ribbon-like protein